MMMHGPVELANRRNGRAAVVVLVAAISLTAGAAGGYLLPKRLGLPASQPGTVDSDATAAIDDEPWYTCGMHPNVLQEGPGICPICQMKLTPLKKDDDGGGASTERKVLYWRAPMDPNYVSEKPGKSPMGMDLVPVYADKEESGSAHSIRIDPVTIQNMGIRTAAIERGPLIKTVRTVGRVDYDEKLVRFVDTKFSGWIEQLDVDETGQHIAKGQKLFGVYSPELYAAQQEYLSAVQNLPRLEASNFAPAREEAVKLVEAAVTKLKYYDVSDEQIEALRETGKIEKTLAIHSPAGGIVTEKMALEGMHVKPGMRLYTIADLSRVWVYVDIYEYQLPWIRVGQNAMMTLPYVPGESFTGKVVYIYPYLEKQTRVIKVRLEFENPKLELKPGMYTNVRLESELQRDAILVPREAYIDSGTRQVAFVDLGNGKFAPRDIQVGVEAEDGMVEVLYGLDAGEVVVTSGQFMLDGESKLKEAVAKMMEAERAETTKRAPANADSTEVAMADGLSMPPGTTHTCPMETHPDETDPAQKGPYFSDKPGRCPPCGMKLKPLDDVEWVRMRRAADGGEVAYTCPDHQHVFSETGGECPRCGKALTPFKVMYNCPDPEHASAIVASPGNCPHCGRGLAAYRGVWLDEKMASANVPPSPGLADVAPYRCQTHLLVNSERAGNCTVCGSELESTATVAAAEPDRTSIPSGAHYTCSMKICWYFAPEKGECPECGMRLKPLEKVAWAKELLAHSSEHTGPAYVCPMHPDTVRSASAGACSICGMQLVRRSALQRPTAAPEHVAAQMNYIMEHYLEFQRLLAADRTNDLTLHALGLVSASETLSEHLADPGMSLPPEVLQAAKRLRAAALRITGKLDADRVTFVELSAAVSSLVEHARPDQSRWPKLYLYHCPMSKGDWFQPAEEKANPYYGFKMLNCGKLKAVK